MAKQNNVLNKVVAPVQEVAPDALVQDAVLVQDAAPVAPVQDAAPVQEVAPIDAEIVSFFKQYPDAPSVLQVGDCLYLTSQIGGAMEYARRMNFEVTEVKNPNL